MENSTDYRVIVNGIIILSTDSVVLAYEMCISTWNSTIIDKNYNLLMYNK